MKDQRAPRGESRYRTLFEQAPVAIWDEDFSSVREFLQSLVAEGTVSLREHLEADPSLVAEAIRRVRVRHVNRAAREFYGAKSEDELINALPSLFDPAAARVFIEEIVALASGASTFSAELVTATLTGERRLVQMNVSMLPDDHEGELLPEWSQVVVAFTDLTERRRLEQSLRRANDLLHRVNNDLEHFAYAAAHDLREPLRTIALYAQLLQASIGRQPALTSEKAVSYILQNTARMQGLIDDLLAFARAIEPDEWAPCPLVDTRAVVSDVLSGIAGAIGTSNTQVVIAPDLPAVPIQPGHLRQVFQNLFTNAIKYRSPGRTPVVEVRALHRDNETVFCVSDNGIGIASEYHQRIFAIFDRLHGANVEGNGIGLAVCKKIVEKYQGRIWVESEVDQGSSFYFSIPLRSGPELEPLAFEIT
jgi:signal transduction histidine kinase